MSEPVEVHPVWHHAHIDATASLLETGGCGPPVVVNVSAMDVLNGRFRLVHRPDWAPKTYEELMRIAIPREWLRGDWRVEPERPTEDFLREADQFARLAWEEVLYGLRSGWRTDGLYWWYGGRAGA